MAARPPVLEFQTLHSGAPVRIDGQLYEIRSPDALPLGALKRLERLAPRIGVLLQRDDLTDDEEQEVAVGLVRLCDLILDAPADVQARLSDAQRVAVMEAFTQLRRSVVTAGARPRLAPPSGGRSRSRGSRGSTAGRRSTGTSGSRSA